MAEGVEQLCRVESFECRGGRVVAVFCRPPVNPLMHPLAEAGREAIRWLQPGSLSMGYADDWSKAYYAYLLPGGGGFYLEGSMDAFDDPSCGGSVVPVVLRELAAMGAPGDALTMLEMILSRKVFRG